MNSKQTIGNDFFKTDAETAAKGLLGKFICRKCDDGSVRRLCITETEAYDGDEDVTYNSKIFLGTGKWCFYYGMLMISCKSEDGCDNVLIRATDCIKGPFNLAQELKVKEIINDINGQDVLNRHKLWLEDWGVQAEMGEPRMRVRLQNKEKTLSEDEVKAPKNYFASPSRILCKPQKWCKIK